MTDMELRDALREQAEQLGARGAVATTLESKALERILAAAHGVALEALFKEGGTCRELAIELLRPALAREIQREQLIAARTRTSPVTPCPEYEGLAFWRAIDEFKAALAAFEALPERDRALARAAARRAFRGGDVPVDLPGNGSAVVARADAALRKVQTALSVPAGWGGTPGGRKCLETDLDVLERTLARFEAGE